ncbi:unnamed protein product, partial [Pylaiella littoralis]
MMAGLGVDNKYLNKVFAATQVDSDAAPKAAVGKEEEDGGYIVKFLHGRETRPARLSREVYLTEPEARVVELKTERDHLRHVNDMLQFIISSMESAQAKVVVGAERRAEKKRFDEVCAAMELDSDEATEASV